MNKARASIELSVLLLQASGFFLVRVALEKQQTAQGERRYAKNPDVESWVF
jgi:hypothetical protein